MKLPSKIKICGLDYSVREDNSLAMNQSCIGLCKTEQLEILLAKSNMAEQKVEQTFFHEITHAINAQFANNELDEKQVTLIANGLYQVLRDNNLLNKAIFCK